MLWGTSLRKVALKNARDLSGSRKRMPKSASSLPKSKVLMCIDEIGLAMMQNLSLLIINHNQPTI